MGKRGTKPKPTQLLKLHGSRRAKTRKSEPQAEPVIGLPRKPLHLQDEASKFWYRMGGVLVKMGLLSDVDIEAFTIMCELYGQYKEADKYSKPIMIKTSNENLIQNPAIGIRNKALERLTRMMAEFGMTPSSRSNIKTEPKQKEESPFKLLLSRSKNA